MTTLLQTAAAIAEILGITPGTMTDDEADMIIAFAIRYAGQL